MLTKLKLINIDKIYFTEVKSPVKVFDFQVEDDHSYNVAGLAVHNSVCTTRVKTGVGYPQLSAVSECAYASHGLKGHTCADGGITCTGDISKAFAGGADFVMIGSLIAGVDECEGEFICDYNKNLSDSLIAKLKLIHDDWEEYSSETQKTFHDFEILGFLIRHKAELKNESNGSKSISYEEFMRIYREVVLVKKFKYYGMSSFESQKKYVGVIKSHRTAEGKVVTIDSKGPVSDVLLDIKGGIRSTCTYVGASKIKDLPKCAKFVMVNRTHNTSYGDNWQKS